MGRLGSRVWVSASFQIFALTAARKCPGWGGKLSGEGMSGKYVRECPEGECQVLFCSLLAIA